MGKERGPRTPISDSGPFSENLDDTFDRAGDSKGREYRMPGGPQQKTPAQPEEDTEGC